MKLKPVNMGIFDRACVRVRVWLFSVMKSARSSLVGPKNPASGGVISGPTQTSAGWW